MPKKNHKVIKAAGALFLSRSTNRYLFLLRDDDTYSDTWGLVGGRVENDEQIIDCLHREITEEIGKIESIIKYMNKLSSTEFPASFFRTMTSIVFRSWLQLEY